jgi:hypothetical protein
MSPCLVQQLFRQKVGLELDPGLIDEVFFPLLRSMKHGPRELLLDIKLTRSSNLNENYVTGVNEVVDRIGIRLNISQFSTIPAPGDHASVLSKAIPQLRYGKLTSKFRRDLLSKKKWGSIEIINELREELDIAHRLRQRYTHTISPDYRHLSRNEIDDMFTDSYYIARGKYTRHRTCGTYGIGHRRAIVM